MVERLRQQALTGQLDERGADRLGRARQHPGAATDGQRARRDAAAAAAKLGWRLPRLLRAGHPVPARRLRRAAARGDRLQLHAAAHLRALPAGRRSRTTSPIFDSTSYISFLWSLGLAALTVAVLALICYPVAYGLVRVFGRWSTLLTLLFTIPLFVSENVRLYGWVLFFIKNGVLLGTLKSLFGVELESRLFTAGSIVLGMVYVYLPFMLFPMTLGVSMVPNETREAAFDLGATPLAGVPRGRAAAVDAGHHHRLPADLRAGGRRHRRGQGAGRPDRSFRSPTTSRSPSPMRRTGRSARRSRCC